jgi:hypothetical protein
MDAGQCHVRAAECAANAQIAVDEAVSLEFLTLAAQWRAMAVRTIFLGTLDAVNAIPQPPSFAPPAVGLIDGKA